MTEHSYGLLWRTPIDRGRSRFLCPAASDTRTKRELLLRRGRSEPCGRNERSERRRFLRQSIFLRNLGTFKAGVGRVAGTVLRGNVTDEQMERIVFETETETRSRLRLNDGEEIDFENDKHREVWWEELNKPLDGRISLITNHKNCLKLFFSLIIMVADRHGIVSVAVFQKCGDLSLSERSSRLTLKKQYTMNKHTKKITSAWYRYVQSGNRTEVCRIPRIWK